jgi:chloramphenicol O-acetyltransferase
MIAEYIGARRLPESLKRNCEERYDECMEFCWVEQEKTFNEFKAKLIKDAEKEYEDAVYEQSDLPTDEGVIKC